jgi:hypothetical protein
VWPSWLAQAGSALVGEHDGRLSAGCERLSVVLMALDRRCIAFAIAFLSSGEKLSEATSTAQFTALTAVSIIASSALDLKHPPEDQHMHTACSKQSS